MIRAICLLGLLVVVLRKNCFDNQFRMYHDGYTAPISIWYQACQYPITQIKWCYLYFQDEGNSSAKDSPDKKKSAAADPSTTELTNVKFATRLCEFFAID